MIQEIAPDITRVAARRQIIRYVLLVNSTASVLKKSAQKVQATTSDRTNITGEELHLKSISENNLLATRRG